MISPKFIVECFTFEHNAVCHDSHTHVYFMYMGVVINHSARVTFTEGRRPFCRLKHLQQAFSHTLGLNILDNSGAHKMATELCYEDPCTLNTFKKK